MIDWNDAFENSTYVDDAEIIAASWDERATKLRDELQSKNRIKIDQIYGDGPREKYDVFAPDGASKGLIVFVHGGYWMSREKSNWSHLAKGSLEQGWHVAMPSYPLAPHARIQEITTSITKAITVLAERYSGPIRLIGHSAGGHLVSRMACKGVLPNDVSTRFEKVVSISGVHHLTPLIGTTLNETLRLDEEEARAESPVFQEPLMDVDICFWVGADERPEFVRQNRIAAEFWERKGARVTSYYEAAQNHFTVIDTLTDPQGALTKEITK